MANILQLAKVVDLEKDEDGIVRILKLEYHNANEIFYPLRKSDPPARILTRTRRVSADQFSRIWDISDTRLAEEVNDLFSNLRKETESESPAHAVNFCSNFC